MVDRVRYLSAMMSRMNGHGASAVTSHDSISVCTIGDLILDVVVLPARPLEPDGDTPASIRLAAGGQAANVAAWASVLGASSRLICKRGVDASSAFASSELERYGVELRGPVVPGHGGVVVSLGDDDAQRTMASDRGVASLLTDAEIEPEWLEGCDVLHVSGYCLFREPMARAAARAAALAPRVTVDLASARDIRSVGEEFGARLRALAPAVIFATEAERAASPDIDTAWVIKLGARGACFPEGSYPARSLHPLDTTGAGDALAAGYLVGGPELAMEAAARCVGVVGAMPSDTSQA